MTRQQEAIAWLWRKVKGWYRIGYRDTWNATEEEVQRLMKGHGMWDDPPKDYTPNRLLDWSRGYLYAEETHYLNAAEAVSFVLRDIAPEVEVAVDAENEDLLPQQDLSQRRGLRIIQNYGFLLKQELDGFTRETEARHYVKVVTSPTLSVVSVEIAQDRFHERLPDWLEVQIRSGFKVCHEDKAIAYKHQVEPLDHKLGIHIEANMIQVCHPSNHHFWSNVQALEDSDEIIATILGATL